jgi:hypothetical protein
MWNPEQQQKAKQLEQELTDAQNKVNESHCKLMATRTPTEAEMRSADDADAHLEDVTRRLKEFGESLVKDRTA